MRVLLIVLISAAAAFAQNFQLVPADPREIVRFKQHFSFPNTDPILTFKLTDNDEKLIALGPKTFQSWDAKKGSLISAVTHDAGTEKNFKLGNLVSPDGSKLAVVDSFRWGLRKEKDLVPVSVYDLRSGKLAGKLTADKASIRSAMWSENGYTLLTFSDVFSSAKETELCFWDGETLAKRSCTIQPGEFQVRILSKDGKRFYSGVDISTHCLSTRSLVIWDAENGAVLSRTKLDDVAVLYSALTLSRSEKFLAQAHFRSVEIGTVGKTYQRNFETHLPKGSTFIDFGSFSPDEKLAAIKNGKNGTEIYDTRTGELKRTLPLADIAPDLWAADGKVLIGYFCGQAKAWSAETGALLYRIKLVCKEHLDIVETVTDDEDRLSLHPDGKYLLSQSGTAVRIWDASSGELLQTVAAPGHEAEKLSKPKGDDYIKGRTARWSGDGKYFYVLAQDEHSVLQYEFTGK